MSGTNLFAGTNDGLSNGGLFLSSNEGSSWIEVTNGVTWKGINAIVISSGAAGNTNIFVGDGPGGGVCRSTNNGTSWTEVDSGLTGTWVTSFAMSGTNLFTGLYYGGVFLSTNNGTSWTAVNEGLPKGQYDRLPYINALAVSGQNLIAGADAGGGAYLSTNSGASWTQTGLIKTTVWCFAVSGTNLFAGTSGGVFLSTNNGSSCTAANTPFSRFSSMAQIGSNLFAGTSGGVFLSTNNGASWTPIGLTNKDITSIAVSPNGKGDTNLFAGTYSDGVWRRPLSEIVTSVERLSPDFPAHFSLEQNYPNPFNPTTNIGFRIVNRGFVSLKVYDVLGNEVAILVNEVKPAGIYEVTWNAGNLSSGVYFYKLQAGSYDETKRMLMMK